MESPSVEVAIRVAEGMDHASRWFSDRTHCAHLYVRNRSAGGQIPEGWEIVTITDDPDVFDGIPDINDRGQMVFSRQLDLSDRASSEIFLYDRGNLIRLTNDDVRDVLARINNKGEIVWSRDFNGDDVTGIVRWVAGELEVISDQADYNEAGVDMNDHGQIVWPAQPVGIIPNDDDLFFYDNGKDCTYYERRVCQQSSPNQQERQVCMDEVRFFRWAMAVNDHALRQRTDPSACKR